MAKRVFRLTKQPVTEETLRAPGGQPIQQDLHPPSNAEWDIESSQIVGDWIFIVWSKLETSLSEYPPR